MEKFGGMQIPYENKHDLKQKKGEKRFELTQHLQFYFILEIPAVYSCIHFVLFRRSRTILNY